VRIEVRIAHDSVWLNRNQIALLFKRDVKTIGKHINNIFKEGELDKKVVVAKFATTTAHGTIQGKTQTLIVDYYNLDVIISAGYRVKSREGTLFRMWATKVLKEYLMKGYAIHIRTENLERSFRNMNERRPMTILHSFTISLFHHFTISPLHHFTIPLSNHPCINC
jgi:hypothetical protein